MKRTVALVTAIFVAATLVFAQPMKNLETLKGKTVPDFRLRRIDGEVQKFSQYRGKVVLLNFWSPY